MGESKQLSKMLWAWHLWARGYFCSHIRKHNNRGKLNNIEIHDIEDKDGDFTVSQSLLSKLKFIAF